MTNQITKSCLIIPCSAKKNNFKGPAYKVYAGALMNIMNTFDLPSVFSHFEVFFLSAKLGLIHSSEVIEPYELRMSSKEKDIIKFANCHRDNAQALLGQYTQNTNTLYTVLSKDYQKAFDEMGLCVEGQFKQVEHFRTARGIGDHRSKLKKIITHHLR